MHHSHDETHRLIPQVGDSMVTNLRRPIFTLLEDTGPGVHDTTVAACDQYLYQQQIGVVSKFTVLSHDVLPPGYHCQAGLAELLISICQALFA